MTASDQVAPSVIALLGQTRPWVRLLAVMFVVGTALMVLGLMVALVAMPKTGDRPAGLSMVALVPVLLLLGLYVPPMLFLWRYGTSIGQLQQRRDLSALEAAIGHQKSFWKYVGILACVMLAIYGVAIVVSVVVGALGHAK